MGAAEAEEGDASRGVAAGFDRRDADPGFDRRERDATFAASPEAASRRKMDEVLSVAASMARLCDAKDAEIAELRETLAARAAAAEIAARVEKDKAEEGGGAHSDTDALANAAEADARASEAQANAAEAEARASEAQANAAEAESRASGARRRTRALERDLALRAGRPAGVRAALRDAELDVKASADRAAAAAAEAAAASKTSAELLTLRARLAAETEETARERSLRETADGEVSRLTLAVASLESALGAAEGRARRSEAETNGLADARVDDEHRVRGLETALETALGDAAATRSALEATRGDLETTREALRQSEFQATRESDRAAALERESADLRASIASHRDALAASKEHAEESAAEIAAARLEARAAERGRVTYLRELEAAEALRAESEKRAGSEAERLSARCRILERECDALRERNQSAAVEAEAARTERSVAEAALSAESDALAATRTELDLARQRRRRRGAPRGTRATPRRRRGKP